MTVCTLPVGVILAGGLSSRMQGPEKTLLPLGQKPMIAHVAERLAKQVSQLVINANGDPARFAFIDADVQPDTLEENPGPLAGVLAGMAWCRRNAPETTHIVTVAGDTPFFPGDLTEKLYAATGRADLEGNGPSISLAYSDGNRHPTFGVWPVKLEDELEQFLLGGDRKVMLFADRYNLQKVEFPLADDNGVVFDPFFNVNTPPDFEAAGEMLSRFG